MVEDLAAAEDRPRELAKMLLEYLSDPAQCASSMRSTSRTWSIHGCARCSHAGGHDGLPAALLSAIDPAAPARWRCIRDGVMLHVDA
ncbi:MAG: hypothetical protein R2722_16700 [Tessaracoccus sp.]